MSSSDGGDALTEPFAHELAARMRAGEVSAREIAAAHLARAHRTDAGLHAWLTLDDELSPLLVDKGSVTLDGVSLTVSAISEPHEQPGWFEVSLIPETLAATTLGGAVAGSRVNVETDVVARHVRRMLALGAGATS